MLSDLAAVVGFYSRLPVPHRPTALSAAVWTVPLAAVVVAAPAALATGFAALVLGPLAAATVGVATLLLVTGALHEDGLADCADGFWGGHTRERRLEIMRDPRHGTYGTLALVLAVVLRVALLAEALACGTLAAMALLLAAAAAARTVALYPWVGLPPARTDGLAVLAGRPTPATFRRALGLGVVVTLALAGWVSLLGVVVAGLAAAGAARAAAALADARIGGHTGDLIGAAVVLAEIAWLAAFLALA